ncbi:VOC family protein [Candidatus Phyllobacterium onerii]|uniref:VOC family protein n=1 Tax=Candidatus Phyllobacterium onerii TaxID=3020828 RepID=UPI00232B828A|nr:VOC family protein [Phyllobacterium sp. IY22]
MQTFAITATDHTGITVSSLEASLSFWVNVLGFRHLYNADFPNDGFLEGVVGVEGAAMKTAMLERDGKQIELLEYLSPLDRGSSQPRSCDPGAMHVAFIVDDIDALLGSIAPHGWYPAGFLQTVMEGERAGLKLAYVRGPDGVVLEFLQPRQIK